MTDAFYLSREWRELRAAALERDRYCCVVPGCAQPAKVVDHIVSRRAGGPDALQNLRSLCVGHDAQVKELSDGRRRNGGKLRVKGVDAEGMPLDPGHPWNNDSP